MLSRDELPPQASQEIQQLLHNNQFEAAEQLYQTWLSHVSNQTLKRADKA